MEQFKPEDFVQVLTYDEEKGKYYWKNALYLGREKGIDLILTSDGRKHAINRDMHKIKSPNLGMHMEWKEEERY